MLRLLTISKVIGCLIGRISKNLWIKKWIRYFIRKVSRRARNDCYCIYASIVYELLVLLFIYELIQFQNLCQPIRSSSSESYLTFSYYSQNFSIFFYSLRTKYLFYSSASNFQSLQYQGIFQWETDLSLDPTNKVSSFSIHCIQLIA